MKAVLLAGITTIVGFISLVSSPIEPLHSFAIFTAIGVGIALLLSITFIPAVLLCKDFNKVQAGRERMKHLTEKVQRRLERARQLAGGKEMKEASGNTLYSIYHFFCGSRVRLVIFTLVILGLSYAGLRILKIDTAIVNYFPENCQLRQDIKSIDENFAGTKINTFGIGFKPGVAVNLNEKLSFVAHVGFLGYENEKVKGDDKSTNSFGLDLSGNNLSFGVYYNF